MSDPNNLPSKSDSPGVLTKIRPPEIVIKIGTATALVSAIAVGLYAYFENHRDVISFAATSIGISAGVASAFYVGKNIQLSVDSRKLEQELRERELIQRKVELTEDKRQYYKKIEDDRKIEIENIKIDRSLSYISTFTSPQFAEIRSRISELSPIIKDINKEQQPKIIREYLQNNSDIEEDVLTTLNFLEQVAVSIESQVVDENILRDYFIFIFNKYYFSFKPWIDDRRNGRDGRLFKAFERTYHKWNGNRAPY